MLPSYTQEYPDTSAQVRSFRLRMPAQVDSAPAQEASPPNQDPSTR
jgi:hypothetical protein